MSSERQVDLQPWVRNEHPTLHADPGALAGFDDHHSSGFERELSLLACWNVLSKRRLTICITAFLLTAAVAIISFRMTPVYRATARLEIEPETPLLQANSDYQRADADEVFLQTQIQVLRSENLAWQTIQQLHLSQDSSSTDPAIQKIQSIGKFLGGLNVEVVPKTRMLSVAFESSNPTMAAQSANALITNYLDYNFRQKYDAIRRSGWLEQQLSEMKQKVEVSQQALVAYDQQHQIVNTSDKQSVSEQMLGDLSRELTSAESERIQKQSLYEQVQANRAQLAALVHDDLLQKLEERSAELKEQHAEALAQYGPNFPKVVRLQSQIDENQGEIAREQDRIINRIHNEYATAANREKLANEAVSSQKAAVGEMNQLLVQHSMLQHEFESNQQLYQGLLQHVKDAAVSAGLRSTNIHLVDEALVPRVPVKPRKLSNIAIALGAGIVLGLMVAFAQETLDSSIKTAEEVESLTISPALAVIPFERLSWLSRRRLGKNSGSDHLTLALSKRPKSPLSEAFRVLGTAISIPSHPPKTLLITSACAGEGKTMTALNLAQALAQRKGPVVIVDCDLRKNGLSQLLGCSNDRGITPVLTGEQDLSEAVQQCSSQRNLWILPSGPIPPNPAELLASDRMSTVLQTLAARFECVVIDSPPVLAVTDAAVLSSRVDGVVLVVASGSTPRGGLVRTRKILASVGARVIGVTMNKFESRRQDRGYYSYTG